MPAADEPDRRALGERCVRARLEELGLDDLVGEGEPADVGNLEFRCPDVAELSMRLLSGGFRVRVRDDGSWDAREPAPRFSLHLKHFAGWPKDKVQAHIDPWGVGGLWISFRHLLDYDGYRDVERIARSRSEV